MEFYLKHIGKVSIHSDMSEIKQEEPEIYGIPLKVNEPTDLQGFFDRPYKFAGTIGTDLIFSLCDMSDMFEKKFAFVHLGLKSSTELIEYKRDNQVCHRVSCNKWPWVKVAAVKPQLACL